MEPTTEKQLRATISDLTKRLEQSGKVKIGDLETAIAEVKYERDTARKELEWRKTDINDLMEQLADRDQTINELNGKLLDENLTRESLARRNVSANIALADNKIVVLERDMWRRAYTEFVAAHAVAAHNAERV